MAVTGVPVQLAEGSQQKSFGTKRSAHPRTNRVAKASRRWAAVYLASVNVVEAPVLNCVAIQPLQHIRPAVQNPTAALDDLRAGFPRNDPGRAQRSWCGDTRLLRRASPVGSCGESPNGREFRQTGPGARRRTARWSAGGDRGP